MPQVGEAWYDVEARTNKLRAALDDADRRVLGSVRNAERGFGSRVTRAIGGIGGAFQQVVKGGVLLGAAGVGGLAAIGGASIKAAADMETMETQWTTLLGSTEKAQARMNELRQFAASTPFEIPEVMQASRTLQVFGGTALATGDNLKLVGDVAAGTNQPFADVAMWVGRMYDAIKSGQPFGEAAQRLQEMGALSGENRRKIEQLAAGVKNGNVSMQDAWKKTQATFGQFSGGMDRLSKTAAGQWSNLMDNLGQTLVGVGQLLLPLAKTVISGFNDALPTIREFLMGVFEKAEPVLRTVGGIFKQVIDGIGNAFSDNGQAATGFGGVVQTVAGIVKKIIDAWVQAWPQVSDTITKVMDVAGKIVSTVVPIIGEAIAWIVTNVLPPLVAAFNGVASWVQQNWPTISSIIQNAAAIIGQVISALWPIIVKIGEVALPLLGAAFSAILPIIDTVIKVVRGVIEFFTGTFVPAIEGVGRGFAAVWDAVSGFFVSIWNGILSAVGSIVGTIIGIVKNLVGVLAGIPGPWQDGAKEQQKALADMETAAKSWGHTTTNTMHSTFDDQLALAKSYGSRTGTAYADGIASAGGYLQTTVYNFTAKARAVMEASSPPGPQSPLHEIDKWGERTAEAYADGWARRASHLRGVIGSVLNGVQPRTNGAVSAYAGAGAVAGGPVQLSVSFDSIFPYTPSQARAAARAIVPELVPILRRQRVIARGG